MPQDKKKRPLLRMFTAVPPSYDLLNRVLTFGMDEHWRKRAAAECLKNSPNRVLDLCTGTGDLALRLSAKAPSTTEISALDYSEPMLERAAQKAKKRNLAAIDFRHGDVADLPYPDAHFDAIGIAFAFRNLTFHNPDREQFLKEIARVLKPGGRFVIVETSQPENKLFRKAFHFYLRYISAPLGGLLSGHWSAYRYLSHSAINYWNAEELTAFLKNSGFNKVEFIPRMSGIAAVYVAVK